MKFFKKFKNKSDYNAYMKNIKVVLPNISYIVENEDAKFNEKPHYVSMIASASQTVKAPAGKSFEYSYDKKNWSTMTDVVEFGVGEKEIVYLRGKNPSGINASFTFGNTTAKIDVGGNCMSLIDWETLPHTVPANGFKNLFKSAAALKSVSNDFLPATNLGDNCYSYMFNGCSSLENSPALPATTLSKACYQDMFGNCYSMLTMPVLAATALTNACYAGMFSGCKKITSATPLPATVLDAFCYGYMFNGCTGLTKAPNLPAETLGFRSYEYMFNGCNRLNEIHCDATDISAERSRLNWVSGVASKGNFYGKTAANWPDGTAGIPNGWTKHLD